MSYHISHKLYWLWIIGTISLNFSNISMNRHIPIGCTGIWLWSNWTTQKFKELLSDSFFFIFTLEQIKATCLVHATFLWNFHCQKSTWVTSFFKPVKGSLKNQFHMTTLSNCLISRKYFHQFGNKFSQEKNLNFSHLMWQSWVTFTVEIWPKHYSQMTTWKIVKWKRNAHQFC